MWETTALPIYWSSEFLVLINWLPSYPNDYCKPFVRRMSSLKWINNALQRRQKMYMKSWVCGVNKGLGTRTVTLAPNDWCKVLSFNHLILRRIGKVSCTRAQTLKKTLKHRKVEDVPLRHAIGCLHNLQAHDYHLYCSRMPGVRGVLYFICFQYLNYYIRCNLQEQWCFNSHTKRKYNIQKYNKNEIGGTKKIEVNDQW